MIHENIWEALNVYIFSAWLCEQRNDTINNAYQFASKRWKSVVEEALNDIESRERCRQLNVEVKIGPCQRETRIKI